MISDFISHFQEIAVAKADLNKRGFNLRVDN